MPTACVPAGAAQRHHAADEGRRGRDRVRRAARNVTFREQAE